MSSAWGKGREHAGGGRRLGQGLEDQKSGRRRDTLGRGTEHQGSVTVQTSQQPLHAVRHCGATATWRRVGSNRMPAQEARVDVFDAEEGSGQVP